MLRRAAQRRIGKTGLGMKRLLSLWASSLVAAAIALGLKLALARQLGVPAADAAHWEGTALAAPSLPPILTGILVLGAYGVLYFGLTALLRVPESAIVFRRLKRR